MNQIERYYKIDRLLNDRGTVSFQTLMGELEISRATLKRDLAYLRDRLNAPIVHDRDAGGYRFDRAAPNLREAALQPPAFAEVRPMGRLLSLWS